MDLRLDAWWCLAFNFLNEAIDNTCPERLLYAKVHP